MDSQERKFYNVMGLEFDPSKEYGRVLRLDRYYHAYVLLAICQARDVVPREFWSGIQILGDLLETRNIEPTKESEGMLPALFGVAWRWSPGETGFSGVDGTWIFDQEIGCLRWTDEREREK